MATTVKIKRSITTATPSGLTEGELAYSEASDNLFIGKSGSNMAVIGGGGTFAQKASPAFTGTPTAPTATAGTSTTQIATTAFVANAVSTGSDGNQSANTVKAGPTNGAAAAPTYRALVAADLPSHSTSLLSDFNTSVDARITAQKGANNGLATLDGTGKVPSSQLPAFVDDVLEFANLAGFPGTGTSGLIYVAQDTNKTYRWSGSVYVEISASPGSTDAVPEGATNKYFTEARVLATILTGLSTATNAAITAADSVLAALGKLQAQVTARLIAANNLSDLTNAGTARTNLGLGTIATQNANGVNITGGTIDGVTIDGGTF